MHGPVPHVSDNAFLEAVVAAAQTQALAGGVLTILVQRHATDFDGEMVTTAAVIEWKDRTDARTQAEPHTPLSQTPEQAGLFDSTEEPSAEEIEALDAPLSEAEEALEEEEVDREFVPEALR